MTGTLVAFVAIPVVVNVTLIRLCHDEFHQLDGAPAKIVSAETDESWSMVVFEEFVVFIA
jgi:hypothetical protein